MRIEEDKGIIYKVWDCPLPEAVFVLVHGMGGYSDRWDLWADYFISKNICSYALDLAGFGRNKGIKGHVDSLSVYINDIGRLCAIAKKKHPGKKIFLSGESLGGLLVFLSGEEMKGVCQGIICLSPAFRSKLKFTFGQRIKFFASLFFSQKKQIRMPFSIYMCARDPAIQEKITADPYEHRLASVRLLSSIFLAQLSAGFKKHSFSMPVFFLLSGQDTIVDSEKSRKIFSRIQAPDKKMITYPGMSHALSIDMDNDKLFADVYDWIKTVDTVLETDEPRDT